MSDGLFARLDDQDRQVLVSSWIGQAMTMASSSVDQPLLMFAAAPLQLLVMRAMQMWSRDDHRPARAVAVGGREARVRYRGGSGVDLDATPLFRRRAITTQEIAGRFTTGRLGSQVLQRGDPVAVVVNDTSWRSRSDGLVVPARFGEPFRIQVPRGRYELSAYSLDPRGRPKVDPITAIGVKNLSRGSQPASSVLLRPRGTLLTRSLLTDFRRQALLPATPPSTRQAASRLAPPRQQPVSAAEVAGGTSTCPNCRKVLYFSFASCLYCGWTLLKTPSRPPQQQAPSFWICKECGKDNWPGLSRCSSCGTAKNAAMLPLAFGPLGYEFLLRDSRRD